MPAPLKLHNKLLEILSHVYFQPPSGVRMLYPCIVYSKKPAQIEYANDNHYKKDDEYQVTVLDMEPDSAYAYTILEKFRYSSITSYFVMNNVNHTNIKLYF